MSRRLTSTQALGLLRDISSDCSDGEQSDENMNDVENEIVQVTLSDEESSNSDNDNELDSGATVSSNNVNTEAEEENDEQIFRGKDGSCWLALAPNQAVSGRLQQQNIMRIRPGPTAYAFSRIISDSPLSSFRIFFNEPMLRNIQKCTIAEAQRVTGDPNWKISLDELEKFLGLIIARGVIGGRTLPILSMWNRLWGCALFSKTMPRHRFLEIMKYLRFDLKSERRQNLEKDKFCLASSLWNPFIKNCQKAFRPNAYITVDEQQLPCKARCKFIQYMANKPDKFGIKFWMAVDVETKYLFNGFPYVGKDESRSGDVSVPTDVVMKLMMPLFKKGHNITSDNYFTSLDLCLRLAKQGCSLVGTIRSNRREIPNNLQETCNLHDTTIVKLADAAVATVTITKYQCKKSKSVNILSSLHPNVAIPSENNPKKKPETVLFCNETKVGVDVLDQMSRCYSVKAGSRRWPIHVFYNVIDMALINSWIIYKHVCNSSISRRMFIQRVSEELTEGTPNKRLQTEGNAAVAECAPTPKKRKTCCGKGCRNRATDICVICKKTVCGKCQTKQCKTCTS